MIDREEPKTGEVWKHFKGKHYKIICIGHHSETKEKMVVYGWCYQIVPKSPWLQPWGAVKKQIKVINYILTMNHVLDR